LASAVGNPLSMHMLLARPAEVRVDSIPAVGSFAPAAGRPAPSGQAPPVVSRKYTVSTPLPVRQWSARLTEGSVSVTY
jgi:hypothetical protein